MKAMAVSKYLNGPERAFGALALFFSVLWPIVAVVKGVAINLELTALALCLQVGLILIGLYFRIRLDSEKVARLAISLGYYLIFVASVANLIEMRFPIDALVLDPILQEIDDAIGYKWSGVLAWLASWPGVGNVLAFIYNTSLLQLAFLMAVLALSGKDRTHYRFLTTAAVSLFLTVAIWMIWPSFGPAISQTIPEDVVGKMTLVVGPEYQTEMLRRVASGATSVPPFTTLGLVAFPSYHTIMA
ncbi:MAG: phosphatase PAP2 family protein, partial [Paracoccaceae bacterium]